MGLFYLLQGEKNILITHFKELPKGNFFMEH
jgi:hypothetical protein